MHHVVRIIFTPINKPVGGDGVFDLGLYQPSDLLPMDDIKISDCSLLT